MARTATPDATAQFKTRGYVITEDNDSAMLDAANALDAIATLCEERTGDVPEMSPAMWGGLFRTFSRQMKAVHDEAGFANEALARKRNG